MQSDQENPQLNDKVRFAFETKGSTLVLGEDGHAGGGSMS